ncbi:hypothetical protein DUT91_16990 [Phyllobacterium salinisoli]|uniref:Uncharacterized protein n=1 Tax=Phyllobacterium salinisoli TaxID=1899321 RepID=A0A368K3L5_9HYPH|nr:hypothetical protein DUT91_16990 [Phyllobacterium salinisoli]
MGLRNRRRNNPPSTLTGRRRAGRNDTLADRAAGGPHRPQGNQHDELLRSKYPQWSVVEDLLREYETWAAKQSLIKRH